MGSNKKAAQKWLDRAEDDLAWTQASLKEGIFYGACFSAQQTAEKALKAFLIANGKSVVKIHDLAALVERCAQLDPSFEALRETVIPLVDYYLQARYPDIAEFIDFTEDKAKDAHKRAEATLAFVTERLP